MSCSTLLVWCRALMCAAFGFVVLCYLGRAECCVVVAAQYSGFGSAVLEEVENLVEVVQECVFVARLDWVGEDALAAGVAEYQELCVPF